MRCLWIIGERARQIDHRGVLVASVKMRVGAQRPGFRPSRVHRDQRVEQLQRHVDLFAIQRRRGAAQQQIVGVGARAPIEPVDPGDDAVGFVGVLGDGETGEQRVRRSIVGGRRRGRGERRGALR